MTASDLHGHHRPSSPAIKTAGWAIFWLVLLFFGTISRADLNVSITPSSDQIIAVGGSVNFSCSATGGCPPYTYAWSFTGASGSPPTTTASPGNVSFGQSAAGASSGNYVKVTVTDANGDTDFNDVYIWVPKFEDLDDDLWYFQDGTGENYNADPTEYATQGYVNVDGLPTDKSVTWKIKGQSDAIKFNNNQQQITGTDAERKITSIGWSTYEDNLWIELEYNGANVATSDTFSCRAPKAVAATNAGTVADGAGFQTTFKYHLTDTFGDDMPDITICEIFSPSTNWPGDYPGQTWSAAARHYANSYFNGSADALDGYGYNYAPATPPPLNPGATGEDTKVNHANQSYKVGGSGTPGVSATGFEIDTFTLQFCRGKAYHQ